MVVGFLTVFLFAQPDQVRTGAQKLVDTDFAILQGHRVGLVINHTARVGDRHLISLVHEAPGVELTIIFGPEHGIRGTEEAGEHVKDGVDVETGAPVYSLYGDVNRPALTMLEGVSALVFDIQDVGARFYTYISTMGLAMQSAAEAGIPFIVLDRPNPLGGMYVAGFVLEKEHTSFVGQYPIPVAHGMTVGELARMIQGEAMLDGLGDLELLVVESDGWQRDMQWPDTGLPWVDTSPNVTSFETALVYPGTCFFEATAASEGRGTDEPFLVVGAPWVDAEAMASELNGRSIPGVRFESVSFTPEPIAGRDTRPKLSGEEAYGLRLHVTDRREYRAVETGMYILEVFQAMGGDAFITRPGWLDRLGGTERLRQMLLGGISAEEIIRAWKDEVAEFLELRAPYLLY